MLKTGLKNVAVHAAKMKNRTELDIRNYVFWRNIVVAAIEIGNGHGLTSSTCPSILHLLLPIFIITTVTSVNHIIITYFMTII